MVVTMSKTVKDKEHPTPKKLWGHHPLSQDEKTSFSHNPDNQVITVTIPKNGKIGPDRTGIRLVQHNGEWRYLFGGTNHVRDSGGLSRIFNHAVNHLAMRESKSTSLEPIFESNCRWWKTDNNGSDKKRWYMPDRFAVTKSKQSGYEARACIYYFSNKGGVSLRKNDDGCFIAQELMEFDDLPDTVQGKLTADTI